MARPKGSKNRPKGEQPAEVEQQAPAAESEFRYSQIDLYQYKREADRYAEQAKEANGNLGSFTNTFLDRTGADKTALAFYRRVMRMDRARGDTTIRHFIHMLAESNRMPEPDLVDQAEGSTAFGRKSPMESKAPPPPDEDQTKTNVVRLETGIKPLEGADAAGTYQVN